MSEAQATVASFEIKDQVGWIWMDDGKANAINPALLNSLENCLREALERGARTVVLMGREGFFSGGLDLKLLPSLSPREAVATLASFGHLIKRLLGFPRPVVAGVTGHAIAGGSVLLLCCDYAVATRGDFKIGLNEAAIGIPLPPVLVELAQLKLSPRGLIRAVAHGELFSVEKAQELGFVDESCEGEELVARCCAVAEQMTRLHGRSYHETKIVLRRAPLKMDPYGLAEHLAPFFQQD